MLDFAPQTVDLSAESLTWTFTIHLSAWFICPEPNKGDLFAILVLNPFNLDFVFLLPVKLFNIYGGKKKIGAFCLLFQML